MDILSVSGCLKRSVVKSNVTVDIFKDPRRFILKTLGRRWQTATTPFFEYSKCGSSKALLITQLL